MPPSPSVPDIRQLRVGTVPYQVGRPLDGTLGERAGIEVRRDVPARLVADLRSGALDVALVSTIELFRRPGYGYLEGLGVCGAGEVSSVQVFARRPIEAVESVAMDPASRAAAALTRVVWPRSGVQFLEVEPGHDPREAQADAWLRIGDRALEETHRRAETGWSHRLNPSARWSDQRGLPFVFAVWITRPGLEPGPWIEPFHEALEDGRAALPRLAEGGARETGLPLEVWRHYLDEECFYAFGPEGHASIQAFGEAAAARSLASRLTPRALARPSAAYR